VDEAIPQTKAAARPETGAGAGVTGSVPVVAFVIVVRLPLASRCSPSM